MIIGRITKVDGVKIVGTFYERLPPHLINHGETTPTPQINSFVRTNVGLDVVVCQIVGEHEFEYDKYRGNESGINDSKENFMVDLEVRGRLSGHSFKGGLRCLPVVGAKIETLDDDAYCALFGNKDDICIGSNLFDLSNKVYLDPNKLIPSHIGIFGNTGSGKSNTMTKLLKEYLDKIPPESNNARILLFDLNNEYGNNSIVSEDQKRIYRLSTRKELEDIDPINKLPINLNQLTEDNWGTLLKATQKTQMPVVRRAYRNWKKKDTDYSFEIKKMLVNKRRQMFFTLRDYAGDYFENIYSVEYNNKFGAFYCGKNYCNDFEDCPNIILNQQLDDFNRFVIELIFEVSRSSESGTNIDYIQPLIPRARTLSKDLEKIIQFDSADGISSLYGDKKIAVIQLGNVNSGTRELIPSLIAELLFQESMKDKGDETTKSITSIVIDEAHNLLMYDPDKNDVIHDNTIRVFERIIKEGRKFGFYLYLSSQRPSDISETITSQIHNYFIHKLVNPRDIDKIRKTVSFMGDSSLSMLSALGQGECIISGPSLFMPQYVYVDELDKEFKPNSSDLILFGETGILTNNENVRKKRKLHKREEINLG